MIILTHRGLEPSRKEFYPESSYEAFHEHLKRGFGIEFDPNFAKDGIVVSHDSNLGRITDGKDKRDFKEVSMNEISGMVYGKEKKGRIPSFKEVLDMIKNSKSKINAMHIKGKFQDKEHLDKIIEVMKKHTETLRKILIFDLKPEFAKYLKEKMPEINLAPSVAHQFDISRYNNAVLGTLISMQEAIKQKNLYSWAWLDEWDTQDNEGEKLFYTRETFSVLRKAGYKIALVTPELHGTSPGLLGGEAHKHAIDRETLFNRIKEIISLKPDAICTDYPEEALRIINGLN